MKETPLEFGSVRLMFYQQKSGGCDMIWWLKHRERSSLRRGLGVQLCFCLRYCHDYSFSIYVYIYIYMTIIRIDISIFVGMFWPHCVPQISIYIYIEICDYTFISLSSDNSHETNARVS